MRMSNPSGPRAPTGQPRLLNNLPRALAASGLSSEAVSDRVEAILGARLDRRTLRRYLAGEPIRDATAVTLAAICRALNVGLDQALSLVAEDPLEVVLSAAGRRVTSAEKAPAPRGWGQPDPAWGKLVAPFLEDRRGRY